MHNQVLIEVKGTISLQMKFFFNGYKNGLEKLYLVHTSNKKYISKEFEQEFKVGDLIVSFLNKYDKLISLLDSYIAQIQNSRTISLDDTGELLEKFKKHIKQELIDLPIIVYFLDLQIYEFYQKLENIENGNITGDKEYNKFQGLPRNGNRYIRKLGFTNYSMKKFLTDLKNSIIEIKELVERTFNLSSQAQCSPFDLQKSDLPQISIEYIENIKSGIQTYIYDINNLKDIFTASIYNLHLSNKFLLKCQRCNNFFIPKTNKKDQKYCYKQDENEEYVCREKGRKHNYYEENKNNNDKLDLLYNRMLNRIKRGEKIKEKYLAYFYTFWEEIKSNYDLNNNKDRQLAHSKLVELDQKINKDFPSKRCTSYQLYSF